jgi:hypothetical protein
LNVHGKGSMRGGIRRQGLDSWQIRVYNCCACTGTDLSRDGHYERHYGHYERLPWPGCRDLATLKRRASIGIQYLANTV